jgi:hypothetical protein
MQTESTDTLISKDRELYVYSSSKGVKKKQRKRRGNKKEKTTDAASSGTNNDNKHNQVKKPSDLSKLNLPQLKLVMRSVGDTDKHGTNEKMISLIRDLIDTANKSMTISVVEDPYSVPLVLDEDSVEKVLLIKVDDGKLAAKDEMLDDVAHTGGNMEQGTHAADDDRGIHSSIDMKSQSDDLLGSDLNKNATIVRVLVSSR